MSNASPSMGPLFSGRFLLRLWRIPLAGHYSDFSQRYLAYVLSPVSIGVLTFFAMCYLGVSHFPGYYKIDGLYHNRYALETTINFGFWLYVMEEWISRLMGPWAAGQRRTVGVTCLLWSGGFLIALVLQLTLIYQRIDLYAPQIMHFFDLYPLRRPSLVLRLGVFTAIWFIALNSRLVFGLCLQRFTERSRQPTGRAGASMAFECPGRNGTAPASEAPPEGSPRLKPLCISTGKYATTVQPEMLAYISSEGHYCRFILVGADKKKEIFARAALKDVVANLPSEDFIQIHRSHVINKHYIEGLRKTGRSYSLCLDGAEAPLPISRHRWPAIRERIDLSGLRERSGRVLQAGM